MKLTYIKENKVDDQYLKNYSNIDRDIFNKIVLMDPKTKVSQGNPEDIGFIAKQLLLPKYLNGETDFVEKEDIVKSAINKYLENISNYPRLNQFASINDFLQFIDNPENKSLLKNNDEEKQKTKLDKLYDQYYSKIPYEEFKKIIELDPESNNEKIGNVSKNLLLPRYLSGDTEYTSNEDIYNKLKNKIAYFIENIDDYPTLRKNLTTYKTIDEFINYLPESPAVTSAVTDLNVNISPNKDYIHIVSSKEYDVFRILTFEASYAIAHSQGLQPVWCTAGGREGTSYGADIRNSIPSRYWNNYVNDKGYYIYEFRSKTRPSDVAYNYNLSLDPKNKVVTEFRDGNNNGKFSEDDSNEEWKSFLIKYPDLALKLISANDIINKNNDLISVCRLLEYAKKPLVIDSETNINKLIFDDRKDLVNTVKQIEIHIPNIPNGIFSNFLMLESVKFGNEVVSIGKQAFMNCSQLEKIELNEGLKVIDIEAFANCSNLKGSIRLPNTVEEIKTYAFLGTRCNLKIDINRKNPIYFDEQDETWVNAHVKGIKI